MKLYGSFLVRCWVIRDENGGQRTVFDIEFIQQGERLRVGNLEEACQWMMEMLETRQPEPLVQGEPFTLADEEEEEQRKDDNS